MSENTTPKKKTSTKSKKSLTELVPEDAVAKSEMVKITEDMIHEEELAAIIDAKEGINDEYADQLEAALVEQDVYEELIDKGEYEAVGLDSSKVTKKTRAEADEEDSENVIVDDIDDDIDHRAGLVLSDFVPDYDTDDEDAEDDVVDAEEKEEPQKRFADSPRISADKTDDSRNFMVKHEGHRAEIVKRGKNEALGDKAFINALNKVKKQVYSTVTIPLVNSGFFAEVQGAGIIDILQLYRDKVSNTESLEYDIERMRAMIKGIKSTIPANVDPLQITASIHQSDYQMLALAYAHATMKHFTIPQTCTNKDCREIFNIEARPIDAILNIDEINEKVATMRDATDYREISLLNDIITIEMENGCVVEIGHPTFLDYLILINSIKSVAEADEAEGLKYATHLKTISMIRKISIPGGLKTSNPYQVFKALSLITEEDFPLVDKAVIELQESVIVPKFGIEAVRCPVCQHVNTNIHIDNIDDMVFFNIMATQF